MVVAERAFLNDWPDEHWTRRDYLRWWTPLEDGKRPFEARYQLGYLKDVCAADQTKCRRREKCTIAAAHGLILLPARPTHRVF